MLIKTLLDENSLVYRYKLLRFSEVKKMVIQHLRKGGYGEKLAYILTLELFLRKLRTYMNSKSAQ